MEHKNSINPVVYLSSVGFKGYKTCVEYRIQLDLIFCLRFALDEWHSMKIDRLLKAFCLRRLHSVYIISATYVISRRHVCVRALIMYVLLFLFIMYVHFFKSLWLFFFVWIRRHSFRSMLVLSILRVASLDKKQFFFKS